MKIIISVDESSENFKKSLTEQCNNIARQIENAVILKQKENADDDYPKVPTMSVDIYDLDNYTIGEVSFIKVL